MLTFTRPTTGPLIQPNCAVPVGPLLQQDPEPTLNSIVDVPRLAVYLMRVWRLTEMGWSFEWDRAINRFGCCSFRNKRITLSWPRASRSLSHVRNTILHEIAHALAGPGHHHNSVWRMWAIRVGARPERCASSEDTKVSQIPGRYQYVCGAGCTFHYHRRPRRDPALYRCRSHRLNLVLKS